MTARSVTGRLLAAAAAFALLPAFPAPAAARDVRPFVGGRIGFLRVEGVDEGSLNIGLLGGWFLAPRFAVEGSLDYHSPEFDRYLRSTYALQGSVYFYPFAVKHHVRPYGVGGAGFYFSEFEFDPDVVPTPDDETHSHGGLHAGFGLDVLLHGRYTSGKVEGPIVLTIDVRYLYTSDDPTGQAADGWLGSVGVRAGF